MYQRNYSVTVSHHKLFSKPDFHFNRSDGTGYWTSSKNRTKKAQLIMKGTSRGVICHTDGPESPKLDRRVKQQVQTFAMDGFRCSKLRLSTQLRLLDMKE